MGAVLDKYFWRWDDILDVNRFRHCLSGTSEARLEGGGQGGGRGGPQAVTLDELLQHEGGSV